ncbi:glycosyltransferase family 4 protein [Candidatus Pelagibacter sp.]|nr:glycosyltransferase family 4 protein [Candidatus Pelagibacter sp.]
MKISISLFGKFHAFYMAKALNNSNYLNKLITSYPKFLVKPDLPYKKIESLFFYEILSRFLRFLQKFRIIDIDINNYISNLFSKSAATKIGIENDFVISWSSKSLEIFEKLKNSKTIKILERGSTHVLFQRDILSEEYKILGLEEPRFLDNKNLILKQLKEYELADYISVPSEFVKKSFIDYGINEKKIIVINYGIDESQFPNLSEKKINDKFIILYVGSTEVRKGIHYLLNAIKLLKNENIELHIVGEISNFLKSIMPKNKNIKLFGHIKQNQLYKFYNYADCLVQPAIEEGQSIVQIQALFSGTPIIFTKNTGGLDFFHNENITPDVIDIRSPKQISDKILHYINNPKILKKNSDEFTKLAKKKLTIDSYGKRLIRKFNEIIKNDNS